MITRSLILDRSVGAFAIDPELSLQLVAAQTATARTRALAGAPTGPLADADRPYSVIQDLGPYDPPPLPYPFQPESYVLVWGAPTAIDGPALAGLLAQRYPPAHRLGLLALRADGDVIGQSTSDPTGLAADLADPALHGCAATVVVGVPPLPIAADLRGLDGLAWVVARLYGPAGCPWDRRQTHQSLRGALLGEAHEVLEALDAGDMPALREELGDLLLSVIAHSEMARQSGHFDLGDVLEQVSAKLIRRHPHVFASLEVEGEGQVLHNWEQIKAAELAEKGKSRASALDGVPPSLPALAAAQELIKKAGRVGFAWPAIGGVWAKLDEELAELRDAADGADPAAIAEEYGDVLFVLTNLGRWLHLDAETALREANAKFRRRFTHIEQLAAAQGRPLSTMGLDELLALWAEAKAR